MFRNQNNEPFSELEKQQLIKAIEQAEQSSSGEIRLHVDLSCSRPPVERAIECFEQLGMTATEERNGVLIYLALQDRKFAIIGDKGINEKVPGNFWDATRDLMLSYFKKDMLVEGLCRGIMHAGEQLQLHFPLSENDANELSNDISFGDHED